MLSSSLSSAATLACALALSLATFTAPAFALEVQAPCKGSNPGGRGLRTCSEVLSNPNTGTVALMRKKVADYLDSVYKTGKEPADAMSSSALSFGPTFCNLIPHPLFNPSAEKTSNKAGSSCGVPMTLRVHVSGLPPHAVITYDRSAPGAETLESGYLRGAFASSLGCFESAVEGEILSRQKITVSPACKDLGQDIDNLGKQAGAIVQGLTTKLGNAGNIDDIDNWMNTGREPSLNGVKDVGALRQSAQQLAAARTSLESAFTHLASCEVFSRAQLAYLAVIADPSAQRAHSQQITDYMKKTCDCSSASDQCVNSCYQRELPGQMAQMIQNYFPPNPSSLGSCKVTP